jgi:hypothetical protein
MTFLVETGCHLVDTRAWNVFTFWMHSHFVGAGCAIVVDVIAEVKPVPVT